MKVTLLIGAAAALFLFGSSVCSALLVLANILIRAAELISTLPQIL